MFKTLGPLFGALIKWPRDSFVSAASAWAILGPSALTGSGVGVVSAWATSKSIADSGAQLTRRLIMALPLLSSSVQFWLPTRIPGKQICRPQQSERMPLALFSQIRSLPPQTSRIPTSLRNHCSIPPLRLGFSPPLLCALSRHRRWPRSPSTQPLFSPLATMRLKWKEGRLGTMSFMSIFSLPMRILQSPPSSQCLKVK